MLFVHVPTMVGCVCAKFWPASPNIYQAVAFYVSQPRFWAPLKIGVWGLCAKKYACLPNFFMVHSWVMGRPKIPENTGISVYTVWPTG